MKHRLLFIPFVLVLAFSALGCIRAASPRGWASPVENGSSILISDSKGKLDSLTATSGERQWRFPDDWDIGDKTAQKTTGIYATPIIDKNQNRAYIADYNGYVFALDLSTAPTRDAQGKVAQKPRILWARKPGGVIIGGMALDSASNTLFVTSDDGHLYGAKVSDTNPTFVPYLKTDDHIWSAPTLGNGTVYVSSTDGRLYAVTLGGTPEIAWSFKASAALVTQPVLSGDTVLVGGFDSALHAVSSSNGQEVWSAAATNWVWAQPLVSGGTVYFADFDGHVYAVNLSDGKPVWSQPFKVADSVRAAPVMVGDTLVVASHDGHIYGIDPKTGASRWDSVAVGADLNADLAKASANATLLYISPDSCVTQAQSKTKLYNYAIAIGANGGTLQTTDKVC